jgi:hypothetical protein
MAEFDFTQIEPFIFLAAGLGCILMSLFLKNSLKSLKVTGEKAEGIIYKLEKTTPNPGPGGFSSGIDSVTIRFVTKTGEWITSQVSRSFASFFTGQYKAGQPVIVYYDPAKPTNFYLETGQSELVGRITIAIVGLVFMTIGLYKLFFEGN